jgi:hypothetical protein
MTRSSLAQRVVRAERRATDKRRDQERQDARARKLVSWRPSR